jgi:PKD repeat protein
MQDSTNTSSFFLYLSSNNNYLTYSWNFGDGSTSNLQYPTHTYAGSGPYQICLAVSNANGCTNTYCDSVYAGRASGGITITVINPAMAGVTDNNTIINSLENYPNPFSNTTTIAYSIKQDASIELNILDLLGNKIAVIESGKKASGTYQTEWNASNISAGIYLLQLKVNNQISIKKLMITK